MRLISRGWSAAALGLSLWACGGDPETNEECGSPNGCAQTGGNAESSGGDTGTGDGAPAGDIPCDVQDALAANCGSCHTSPPSFGAPMPLLSIEDFRSAAVTDPSISVADFALARMAAEQSPMPPDASLGSDDRDVIEAWIAAGMPGELDAECTAGQDGGNEPNVELPCEPDQFFLAGNAARDDGFSAPLVDDLYQCFVFDSPFTDQTQGIAWAPVIDDTRVVHHWLLLRGDENVENGTYPCTGMGSTFDAPMLMGWAPGTGSFVMPEEAGLELPGPGEKLILQIHYNNSAGYTDINDRSGVAICTTEEPRPQTASTLWLGSLLIDVPPGGTQEVSNDCDTARLDEPVNVLLNWPHMHETGRSIKTELFRAGSTEAQSLADVPSWNFENQVYYPHTPAVVVQPGDILRTTCNFRNDSDQRVTFGEGTGDEMCFDFAIVYPITAFDVANPFGPPELGRYCIDYGDRIPGG